MCVPAYVPPPPPGSHAATGWYAVQRGSHWVVAKELHGNIAGTYTEVLRPGGFSNAFRYSTQAAAQHTADLMNYRDTAEYARALS